jgi:hypothetical protein
MKSAGLLKVSTDRIAHLNFFVREPLRAPDNAPNL